MGAIRSGHEGRRDRWIESLLGKGGPEAWERLHGALHLEHCLARNVTYSETTMTLSTAGLSLAGSCVPVWFGR